MISYKMGLGDLFYRDEIEMASFINGLTRDRQLAIWNDIHSDPVLGPIARKPTKAGRKAIQHRVDKWKKQFENQDRLEAKWKEETNQQVKERNNAQLDEAKRLSTMAALYKPYNRWHADHKPIKPIRWSKLPFGQEGTTLNNIEHARNIAQSVGTHLDPYRTSNVLIESVGGKRRTRKQRKQRKQRTTRRH